MLLVISNNFSRGVVEEYLKYFNFERDMLDVALRKFLAQFLSTSETQERKRVLVFFSKRCIDCNPGSFNSQNEDESASQVKQSVDGPATSTSGNPFLDVPNVSGATKFKKGYA
ncbi:PH and SEC7 domain-containing protein-like isoform X2 [Cotesia typhae]|uniref:PH and SEC7 domain-containing protein-like isoform X2 n=1 Tax=Cotesia typhae TaxID=2053667 RepID=UPI003D69F92B